MPPTQAQRAYWAKKRAAERTEADQARRAERAAANPNHPDNHRCTERTLDYSPDRIVCTVCRRSWTLTVVNEQGFAVWVVRPKTLKMPPLRPEQMEQQ